MNGIWFLHKSLVDVSQMGINHWNLNATLSGEQEGLTFRSFLHFFSKELSAQHFQQLGRMWSQWAANFSVLLLVSLYPTFHLIGFFPSLILFPDVSIVQQSRKFSAFGVVGNVQTQSQHGKKLKLDLSGVISQMSQMKPFSIQLLIGKYLKVNKECRQERIIVLAKSEHLKIEF